MCGIFVFSCLSETKIFFFSFKFKLTFLGYHVFGYYAMLLKTEILKFKLMGAKLYNQ